MHDLSLNILDMVENSIDAKARTTLYVETGRLMGWEWTKKIFQKLLTPSLLQKLAGKWGWAFLF